MSEREIQKTLYRHFYDHKYHLNNAYIFKNDWETDFYSMSATGYSYEIEIKVSRSDFKADFKKQKHRFFEKINDKFLVLRNNRGRGDVLGKTPNYRYILAEASGIQIVPIEKIRMPHKFFFACPEGLLTREDIPKYAGLIHICEDGLDPKHPSYHAKIVKNAPFLHKRDLDIKHILLEKFYYKSVDLNQLKDSLDKKHREVDALTKFLNSIGYEVNLEQKEIYQKKQ